MIPRRRQHGRTTKICLGPQQLRFTAGEGHGHQLVAAAGFHHPQPALAPQVDQAFGKTALAPAQGLGKPPGRLPMGHAEMPETAIAVVDEHHLIGGHRVATTAKFMGAAAQVPGARS